MNLDAQRGRRIREERVKLGWSQQQAADAVEVRREMWAKYEAGSEPGAKALARMAAAGADVLYILHGTRLSEQELVVIGVTARLMQLGAPPDASAGAVMQFIEAHPDVDPMWLLTGQAQKIDGPLNHKEAVLVSNYRAADEAGKKIIEGTAVLAAQSDKRKKA